MGALPTPNIPLLEKDIVVVWEEILQSTFTKVKNSATVHVHSGLKEKCAVIMHYLFT